ncbi:Dihydroxy-acid dehydratase [Dissostichus eleginoides]|uniref:Dihydroxy-acid dehydratase n=1 Tax=Dissostichus eleginoides TaxID=100907 RepID=A0AAD9CF66_DISEL|nr:Dihydroxy-acid dehydratase [Dissostichus eleginoides]
MGGGSSHVEMITRVLKVYQKTLGDQCVLPDVGIDESLLKYSGYRCTKESSYSMLRRVFGEEKASGVRDTVSECLRRHLTILKNSLLLDQQMSTRGFKIWVNGAAFHVQMLIHEARLNVETGSSDSDYFNAIQVAINVYLLDLDHLLDKYKTYKTCTTAYRDQQYCYLTCGPSECIAYNRETKCSFYMGYDPVIPVMS